MPNGVRRIEIAPARGVSAPTERLTWRETARHRVSRGIEEVVFDTDRGALRGMYHAARGAGKNVRSQAAVLCVGGTADGVNGPAHGLYPELCTQLQMHGIAGLRLSYRHRNLLNECTLDTLGGIAFLANEGATRIGLVGHSFGGAVVISAAALSRETAAVVLLASQTAGTELLPFIAPRPLLLAHGTKDEVLPMQCSELLYAAAAEPKMLRLFSGAGHGFENVRADLLALLAAWLPEQLVRTESG